jgi:hypothetical protein
MDLPRPLLLELKEIMVPHKPNSLQLQAIMARRKLLRPQLGVTMALHRHQHQLREIMVPHKPHRLKLRVLMVHHQHLRLKPRAIMVHRKPHKPQLEEITAPHRHQHQLKEIMDLLKLLQLRLRAIMDHLRHQHLQHKAIMAPHKVPLSQPMEILAMPKELLLEVIRLTMEMQVHQEHHQMKDFRPTEMEVLEPQVDVHHLAALLLLAWQTVFSRCCQLPI